MRGKAILTTFAYDENGLRTHKENNNVTTSYYYNGSILMGMVTGSGSTAIHQLFSYDSSGNVGSVDYSTNGRSTFTTYYYVRNAQNDVVKLINGSGTTVVEYTYDTWGKLLSTTGSLASTLGANQPFRDRGYVYDTETGWYYLQSRYYDPSICRFISADVLLSTGQGVLGHNAFAYCLNNPTNMIDKQGDSATLVIGGVTISFVNLAILLVCLVIIVDLMIDQEDSLIMQFLIGLSEVVVDSVEAVLTVWDSVVISKAGSDSDPYARPGQKKQGRERKNKARQSDKWKPRSKPKVPKRHTPGKAHRKYTFIPIFEEEV